MGQELRPTAKHRALRRLQRGRTSPSDAAVGVFSSPLRLAWWVQCCHSKVRERASPGKEGSWETCRRAFARALLVCRSARAPARAQARRGRAYLEGQVGDDERTKKKNICIHAASFHEALPVGTQQTQRARHVIVCAVNERAKCRANGAWVEARAPWIRQQRKHKVKSSRVRIQSAHGFAGARAMGRRTDRAYLGYASRACNVAFESRACADRVSRSAPGTIFCFLGDVGLRRSGCKAGA